MALKRPKLKEADYGEAELSCASSSEPKALERPRPALALPFIVQATVWESRTFVPVPSHLLK